MFEVEKTAIEGVVILTPKVLGDDRGYFMESYSKKKLQEHIGDVDFIQDNESSSSKHVLRGLHFQKPPFDQAKLVRVISGKVIDVAVDIRKSSATFGQYVAVELSADNKKQLFIPRGFAHGFLTLTDDTIFSYKVDNYYSYEHDSGLRFDDPDINIDWTVPLKELLISEKDRKTPSLKDAFTFE